MCRQVGLRSLAAGILVVLTFFFVLASGSMCAVLPRLLRSRETSVACMDPLRLSQISSKAGRGLCSAEAGDLEPAHQVVTCKLLADGGCFGRPGERRISVGWSII